MIEVPAGFRAMPRWWSEGTAWLDALPVLAVEQCERWSLRLDGSPRHGSHALVIPVLQDGEPFALRLTPPDERLEATITALRFWDGRGTVRLLAADADRGALLLERLDAGRSLATLPPAESLPILGRTIRRLAVPAPLTARSTGEDIAADADTWRGRWEHLGRPLEVRLLDATIAAADQIREPETPELAVDADLHGEQVLAATREPWLVVDPVLLRGDLGYDLARILWSALDDLGDDADLQRWVRVLSDAAEIGMERSTAWVAARAVSYLLWGLEQGLTEDPPRCRRLVSVFAEPGR